MPRSRGHAVIPFPLSNAPGARGQDGAGRILNAYVEPLGETAPSNIVYRRAPGLVNFGTTTRSGFRGAIEVNGTIYCAFSGKAETFTSSGGASTSIGNLNGTKKGFFARNNKSPTPDIVFVDPDTNIATLTSGSVTNSSPSINLPAVNSCCSFDGYIIFTTGSGQIWASALNDVTSVNSLSFTTAQAKPDGLLRCIPWGQYLLAFGNYTTEVYVDVGTTPFPLTRQTVIYRGMIGPYCVAGHEDAFGAGLAWVGDDNAVYMLNGLSPFKISPPDLDALIEAVSDKTTLEASVYISRGHAFWQLSCAAWTWTFDFNTQKWHQRDSYQQTRSRITRSFNAFGTMWLTGDMLTGNIQQITSNAYNEVGSPLRFRLESGPVEEFPIGERVGRADFEFITGVGVASGTDPIQTTPSVEISWSDDGAQTWRPPMIRTLGAQSQTNTLVSLVSCTGRSLWNGRRWRLDVSDPVYVGFMGGTQSVSSRPQ